MHRRMRWMVGAGLAWGLAGCESLKAVIIENYPNDWDDELGAAHAAPSRLATIQPTFDGADTERPQIPVALKPLITNLKQPTDIQIPPGHPDTAVVAEKEGQVRVFSLASAPTDQGTSLLALDGPTGSEQGVLGLAFHPTFGPEGGRLYVHHTVRTDDGNVGRVSVMPITVDGPRWSAGALATVLQLPQPYPNHNGGQLQFGPDGMLYVGFGDGGWRNDPHGHGQDAGTWLGSMLRRSSSQGPSPKAS